MKDLRSVHAVPGGGRLQLVVDVIDVLNAFRLKPLPERVGPFFRIHGDPVLPGSATAENAVELYARFACKLESF